MDAAIVDQTSQQYLGQWKRLVSTTNWDKGQIIAAWREELLGNGAAASVYSDEAWSQRVGNVTPQHVGRLRRVYERFASSADSYQGLYWSHFQAALDWDNAEMWLEGAVQNDWSISQMRAQRGETLGELTDAESDTALESADLDEDAETDEANGVGLSGTLDRVRDPGTATGGGNARANDDEDESRGGSDDDDAPFDEASGTADSYAAQIAPIRPFAGLPSLPADVHDAFEAYKLCILRHKLQTWRDISLDDMLASLQSLQELAMAPAE